VLNARFVCQLRLPVAAGWRQHRATAICSTSLFVYYYYPSLITSDVNTKQTSCMATVA